MKIHFNSFILLNGLMFLFTACISETKGSPGEPAGDSNSIQALTTDTAVDNTVFTDTTTAAGTETVIAADTGKVKPDSLVAFARTLQGVPYRYASTDPAKGFDCSGFITYVFNHFKMTVPRSSVSFTNYGKTIPESSARPGDLILFTGTDSTVRVVGHMGIVERIKNDTLYFIHSSSGKANGVTISPLGKYYRGRFVKTIRVFPDELFSEKK